jgi:hypothetical protein
MRFKQYPYLLAVLMLLSLTAGAVELKRLAVEFTKYPFYSSFAELPDESVRESLAVTFDVDLGARFSWRNRIHSLSTDSQFRAVGWQYELAWRVLPSLEIIPWAHHSQHALDRPQPGARHFSVQDGVGIRWVIYERR